MNVQVDNLWFVLFSPSVCKRLKSGFFSCFLSQERVAEFAKLNPSTLLKETQRTAGHVKLTEWHETLIVEKQRLLSLEVALKDERNNLKREEDANKGNERDVRRYEERQGVEKEVRLNYIYLKGVSLLITFRWTTDQDSQSPNPLLEIF